MEHDSSNAARDLAATVREFADLADLGGDPRDIRVTIADPAGQQTAEITDSTARWIRQLIQAEIDGMRPEDDIAGDLWGP